MGKKSRTPRELRQLTSHADVIEAARKEGWRIEPTTRGHAMCYPPAGRDRDPQGNLISPITAPQRNGDRRGVKNFVSAMIRAGLGGGTPNQPYKHEGPAPVTQTPELEPETKAAPPPAKKPVISSKPKEPIMADNIFSTTRRVIEQVKGELNPKQMLAAFREYLRTEYNMELPEEAEFKLVCADENAGDVVEFPLTTATTGVQLEISYEKEEREPLKLTSTIKN